MGLVHHQNNRKRSEDYSILLPSPVEFSSLLFLFILFNAAAAQSVVKTLPRYLGNTLPFNLETWYVTVGEKGGCGAFLLLHPVGEGSGQRSSHVMAHRWSWLLCFLRSCLSNRAN